MRLLSYVELAACFGLWGCSDHLSLEICDIREADCQINVFLALQDARHEGWDPWLEVPSMRVISIAQFRDELNAAYDDPVPASPVAPPFDPVNVALKLFRMIDPTVENETEERIDTQLNIVAAYYDPYRNRTTIIDRGASEDPQADMRVLAHELTHAAQQRTQDLRTWHERTLSNYHARQAVIEGEATLYANLIDVALSRINPLTVDWEQYHETYLDGVRREVAATGSPWLSMHVLNYPLGSRLLTDRWLQGGSVSVRALYRDLPREIGQLLSAPALTNAEMPSLLDCGAPPAPDGFALMTQATLGSLSVFGFATRLLAAEVFDLEGAWQIAQNWRGDLFTVYAADREQTIAVWRIQLSQGAEQLFEGAKALLGSEQVYRTATTVYLVQSDAELPSWTDWRECTGMSPKGTQ